MPAVGIGIGRVTGATIHLEVDPTTRAVRARASPLDMVFFVALLLALGLFLARSLEMGLRARAAEPGGGGGGFCVRISLY